MDEYAIGIGVIWAVSASAVSKKKHIFIQPKGIYNNKKKTNWNKKGAGFK